MAAKKGPPDKQKGNEVGRRDFLKLAASAGAGVALGGAGGFVMGQAVNQTLETPTKGGVRDGAAGKSISAYPRLKVGSLSGLKAGQPVTFDYPLKGLKNLMVKLGEPAHGGVGPDRDVIAHSVLCTHMGCPLDGAFDKDHNVLGPCVCHFTTFDLTLGGMPVTGCATEPLPRVILEVDSAGTIFAVGVDGLIYGQRDNLSDRPAL